MQLFLWFNDDDFYIVPLLANLLNMRITEEREIMTTVYCTLDLRKNTKINITNADPGFLANLDPDPCLAR